jgi:acyl carrier protein
MASELQLREMIAVIVGIETSDFSNESTLDEIGWDSLSVLEFIAKLDSTFGVRLSMDSLSQVTTVGQLIASVEK